MSIRLVFVQGRPAMSVKEAIKVDFTMDFDTVVVEGSTGKSYGTKTLIRGSNFRIDEVNDFGGSRKKSQCNSKIINLTTYQDLVTINSSRVQAAFMGGVSETKSRVKENAFYHALP